MVAVAVLAERPSRAFPRDPPYTPPPVAANDSADVRMVTGFVGKTGATLSVPLNSHMIVRGWGDE